MMRYVGMVILLVILMAAGTAGQQGEVAAVRLGDAEGLFIVGVPDASQPPENRLCFSLVDNWCAPLAAANALCFLDQVEWAHGVCGELNPLIVSEYLGYFMATNGEGSPGRANARQHLPGTLVADIPAGVKESVRWDRDNLFQTPPPEPIEKSGLDWWVECVGTDAALDVFLASIEAGIPPIVCFSYWNPLVVEKEEVETNGERTPIYFASWGASLNSTDALRKENPKVPAELWDEKHGIGHAVTGVGFIKGDPDGSGPLAETLWLIVHDNWATTPQEIAIPWDHVSAVVIYTPLR